jgi:hypothetical protein
MQITHPLQAGVSRPMDQALVSVEERVVESKVRARRRRIVRSVLLLLTTSVMLCGFVFWQRDSTLITKSLQAIDPSMSELQKKIDLLGRLPAVMPGPDGVMESYSSSADRFYAMNSGKPTIVAVSSLVPIVLGQDGRCVIIYDQGKVYSEWMSQRRFEAAMQTQWAATKAFEKERHDRPPVLP